MPKRTPGPWHIYEDEDGEQLLEDKDGARGYDVINDDGEFVARVTNGVNQLTDKYQSTWEQVLVEAQLMAAAPAMHHLLAELVELYDAANRAAEKGEDAMEIYQHTGDVAERARTILKEIDHA